MNIKEMSTSSLYDILELLQLTVGSIYYKKGSLLHQIENLDKLSRALENIDEKSVRKMRDIIFEELDTREK